MTISVEFNGSVLIFQDHSVVSRQIEQIIVSNLYHPIVSGRSFALKTTDVVVDIGANVGVFSIPTATIVQHVYAYEPIEENFAMLSLHKSMNATENLTIFKLGVSDRAKNVDIFLSSHNISGHSIYPEKILHEEKECAGKSERACCIPLRQVFTDNEIEHCDFLKLDCEGEEYSIIESLEDEDFQRIDKIVLEYHYVPGKSIWLLAEMLSAKGYFLALHHKRANFGQLYAVRDVQ